MELQALARAGCEIQAGDTSEWPEGVLDGLDAAIWKVAVELVRRQRRALVAAKAAVE